MCSWCAVVSREGSCGRLHREAVRRRLRGMQSAEQVPAKRKQPRGGSRKGRPNKFSNSIKLEVLESFRMVGARHYLARQAAENPPAYLNLLGKVIPQQVQAELAGLHIVVQQLAVSPPPGGVPGVLSHPDPRWIALPSAEQAEPVNANDTEEVAQ